MIRGFVLFLCLIGLPFVAIPCSFVGLEHEIEFDPQSATLGTKNARALVDWFIKWRDGMGITEISIYVTSIENDPHSIFVARERMSNIVRIIKRLNKGNVPIELSDRDRVSAHSPTAFLSNLAIVTIQPACLKTNTCCPQPIKQQDNP